MITIDESGMIFGPYSENDIYMIEKSKSYISIGCGVKTVEFLYRDNNYFYFIEAKSGGPNPKGERFEDYVNNIADKFIHSFNLWLTLFFERRCDTISLRMIDIDMRKSIFLFVLVIKDHNKEWLPAIKAAIDRRMCAEIKIWGHRIIVINDEQAKKRKLIK